MVQSYVAKEIADMVRQNARICIIPAIGSTSIISSRNHAPVIHYLLHMTIIMLKYCIETSSYLSRKLSNKRCSRHVLIKTSGSVSRSPSNFNVTVWLFVPVKQYSHASTIKLNPVFQRDDHRDLASFYLRHAGDK